MRSFQNGGPYGIRTRVSTLRGWCPRPLDEGTCGSSDQMVSHPLTSRPCTGTPSANRSIPWRRLALPSTRSAATHRESKRAPGRPGPGLLASWGEPLGRGVTVARLALDQLVQVRILAAQRSPSRVGPRAVAVRAHHIALGDLRKELLDGQLAQAVPPDGVALRGGIPMVEVHHVSGVAHSAVGTRPVLRPGDQGADGFPSFQVAARSYRPIGNRVPCVVGAHVGSSTVRAVRLEPILPG